MLEDIQWATFFDDDAAINEEDAGADFSGESHFMCHDDHSHALFCDFTHDIQDFMHHFRV